MLSLETPGEKGFLTVDDKHDDTPDGPRDLLEPGEEGLGRKGGGVCVGRAIADDAECEDDQDELRGPVSQGAFRENWERIDLATTTPWRKDLGNDTSGVTVRKGRGVVWDGHDRCRHCFEEDEGDLERRSVWRSIQYPD